MNPVLDLKAALASCAPPPGADGDALLDAWREARDAATDAYRAWRSSSRSRAGEAYAVYLAADDREAAAADAMARWVAWRSSRPFINSTPEDLS